MATNDSSDSRQRKPDAPQDPKDDASRGKATPDPEAGFDREVGDLEDPDAEDDHAGNDRHEVAAALDPEGGIVTFEAPIHASNVMILCKDCGATRIGIRIDDDGRKHRVCRKCGGDL